MTRLNFFWAGPITAVIIAGPAIARERHVASHHLVVDRYGTGDTYAGTATNAPSCIYAPRVGAFATEPWTNSSMRALFRILICLRGELTEAGRRADELFDQLREHWSWKKSAADQNCEQP
jgi:hypothetical protein